MGDELKPCPFCARPGELHADYAGCFHEDCPMDIVTTMSTALAYDVVAAWNTRPIEEDLRARLAVAEAERERYRRVLSDEGVEAVANMLVRRGVSPDATRGLSPAILAALRERVEADRG